MAIEFYFLLQLSYIDSAVTRCSDTRHTDCTNHDIHAQRVHEDRIQDR